jgi:HlyD family secretion protein
MKKINFVISLCVWIVVLAACSSTTQATPTPVASAQKVAAVVSASGKVLPARWANLSFRAGGPIVDLKVQTGETVKAGGLIAQLDEVDAKLAAAQSEAALALAQAQLAQLKAGPRAEQVAQAEQAVAQAEAAWKGAQAQYGQLRSGARAADIAAAEAEVAQAAAQRKVTQDAYDKTTKCYDFVKNGKKDSVCPGLGTPEEQARAALAAANEAYAAAQKRVDQLKAGATRNEIAAADANVAAALAQVEQSKAQRDLLKAGASLEAIAVAEAGIKQAQVALDTAKAQLDKLQLSAPFNGTVGTVYVREGELASPGQPIVTLGDLTSLRIETTDLSEVDIARVKVGQPVKVTFDALPGKTIAGKVTRIAPMSTPGQSAVNYSVTVELDQLDPALRWGMTAFVDVQVGE